MRNLRKDFPILQRKVHGKPLVYLDNAATTQKPRQVIDAVRRYYERTNANIHRGIHTLAEEATEAYEGARKRVAEFIGAKDSAEIIFVRNATEAINLVAHSYVRRGAAVVLSEMEHHSNIVPWHIRRARLKYIPVTQSGTLDYSSLDRLITKKTAFVSVTHASNVLGTINDIPRIVKAAQKKGVLVLVDAAQSVPHMPVDVQKLGCDFLAFSGHKMLGPTGIGVLWGRRELLEAMPPFLGGGDMIRHVEYERFEPNDLPWKFEAGTPNIAGAIGLDAAIEYLQEIGMERIRRHEIELTRYALREMKKIIGVRLYGLAGTEKRTGIISFTLDGVHAHDLATVLNENGIAIRSGYHCAEPLVRKLGVVALARVSFFFYNTKTEVDRFLLVLRRVRGMFHII